MDAGWSATKTFVNLLFRPNHVLSSQQHHLRRDTSYTYLVGDVVDGDVMHGCRVTLEQSVKVSPTVPKTGNTGTIVSSDYIFMGAVFLFSCFILETTKYT